MTMNAPRPQLISPRTREEVEQFIRDERKWEYATVAEFLAALNCADRERLWRACGQVDQATIHVHGWRCAFRRAAELTDIPAGIRREFRSIWIKYGDHIRQETGSDAILIDGLRAILPAYKGGALTLFRGDGAWNCRHRLYGSSWTSSRKIAEAFALGLWRCSRGGSVLIQARVPRAGIVAKITGGGEEEYIVDRRRLDRVTVAARFDRVDPSAVLGLVKS